MTGVLDMPNWTAKTYGAVADLLYRLKPVPDTQFFIERVAQWQETVLAFSKMFQEDNNKFNKQLFHRACSIKEDDDI